MDNREREAARMLAVSFNAYIEARDAGRDADVFMWAKALLEAQRATRIEIFSPVALLYPLTDDHRAPVAEERARAVLKLDDMPTAARDDDDNGPSPLPVLSPVPPPRKPSPSAALSPAQRAAAYFAAK